MEAQRERAVQAGVRQAILDTAATVIAERGGSVSMAAIAAATGIGRATLYRYFPNRESLLAGLTAAALDDLGDRIAAAELATVDTQEGIARLSRAFLAAATRYAALVHTRDKYLEKPADLETKVAGPVLELLCRGVDSGQLRADVPLPLQFELLTGLYEKVMHLVLSGQLGAERASALVTSVFLTGVGPPSAPRTGNFSPVSGSG